MNVNNNNPYSNPYYTPPTTPEKKEEEKKDTFMRYTGGSRGTAGTFKETDRYDDDDVTENPFNECPEIPVPDCVIS